MTSIDRAAEADRYTRLGRTTDRINRMSAGRIKQYRGHYAHQWFSLAASTRRHFVDGPRFEREEAEARHYGIAAALCERPAAPGAHGPLLALIGAVPVGQGRTRRLMTAWLRGYQDQIDTLLADVAVG